MDQLSENQISLECKICKQKFQQKDMFQHFLACSKNKQCQKMLETTIEMPQNLQKVEVKQQEKNEIKQPQQWLPQQENLSQEKIQTQQQLQSIEQMNLLGYKMENKDNSPLVAKDQSQPQSKKKIIVGPIVDIRDQKYEQNNQDPKLEFMPPQQNIQIQEQKLFNQRLIIQEDKIIPPPQSIHQEKKNSSPPNQLNFERANQIKCEYCDHNFPFNEYQTHLSICDAKIRLDEYVQDLNLADRIKEFGSGGIQSVDVPAAVPVLVPNQVNQQGQQSEKGKIVAKYLQIMKEHQDIINQGNRLYESANWKKQIYDYSFSGLACEECQKQFTIDDMINTLSCLHKYHKQCIDKSLLTSSKCPKCSNEIFN